MMRVRIWVPVRQGDDGQDWFEVESWGLSREIAEANAQETAKKIPIWAAGNPIVRFAWVELKEVGEMKPIIDRYETILKDLDTLTGDIRNREAKDLGEKIIRQRALNTVSECRRKLLTIYLDIQDIDRMGVQDAEAD